MIQSVLQTFNGKLWFGNHLKCTKTFFKINNGIHFNNTE